MSEETLKQEPTLQQILEAIIQTNKRFDYFETRFDYFEKSTNAQFEAIRRGIVENSARFDRLDAKTYDVRSDISNLKATITELTEEVHSLKIGI